MAAMERVRVQLDYPLEVVKEPIIYRLVTEFRLIPNIRRGNIDAHVGGMLIVEIAGDHDDIEAGLEFLTRQGITVTPVGGEQAWTI